MLIFDFVFSIGIVIVYCWFLSKISLQHRVYTIYGKCDFFQQHNKKKSQKKVSRGGFGQSVAWPEDQKFFFSAQYKHYNKWVQVCKKKFAQERWWQNSEGIFEEACTQIKASRHRPEFIVVPHRVNFSAEWWLWIRALDERNTQCWMLCFEIHKI